MRFIPFAALALFGCSESSPQGAPPSDASFAFPPSDGGFAPSPGDASAAGIQDMAIMHNSDGAAGAPDGGGYMPPNGPDDPLAHAAPTPITVAALPGAGLVYDVGVDRGGGVWAVSPSTVYYWPQASGAPFTYSQANGLARGNAQNPFAAVAGGNPGQAIVGNRGAIADALAVDPHSGAILSINNMVVPFSNSPEYQEHLIRVVAGIRVAVDLDGTFHGTGYIGGTHGFTAYHGLDEACGCEQFQEHQHFMPGPETNYCDSTMPPFGCWGGDVKGLAISPLGDVWAGDEHFVSLLPQRSLGAFTDFFQSFTVGIDVFPAVNDEVSALAVDGAGGVWVASFGNGLAYLQPMTHVASYFDRARELPQNRLTAVLVDGDGSVWVGTDSAGIARNTKSGWLYYTFASGLPADEITSLAVDRNARPRRIYIGTTSGVAVYSGQ